MDSISQETQAIAILLLTLIAGPLDRRRISIPSTTNLPPDKIRQGILHKFITRYQRITPQYLQHQRRVVNGTTNPSPQDLHQPILILPRPSSVAIPNVNYVIKPVITPSLIVISSNPSDRPVRPWRGTAAKPCSTCPVLPCRLRRIRPAPDLSENISLRVRRDCHPRQSLGQRRGSRGVGEACYLGSGESCWWRKRYSGWPDVPRGSQLRRSC